ncbi:MAG: NUDIX hydrolase [Deltaproteobacteria bacterium CG2_30_63_29]|nr:MAG: NUDIX hydrolase [Deltaproteobacteria bacterium CG2_30_63_29]PIW00325.1 MAG: NUDIX hydrolase [Deltaproteobacteria bacterium CG17_big_fil_post_rev_8_21_14_2_50_63_7]PJB34786.1 MAG: NUDIX hydrolase [Deltaproteobacteria bacterium CG_4_9_14_3_um_filter_63_12]
MTVYRNPTPTVDVIIELEGGVVLIERANEPRGWALPGGFVDYGESLEDAARREAKEETTLDVELTDLLYVYSAPGRDPRLHTVSTVFVGRASGAPQGSDDAMNAHIFSLDSLPEVIAFDHREILADYRAFKATGNPRKPR